MMQGECEHEMNTGGRRRCPLIHRSADACNVYPKPAKRLDASAPEPHVAGTTPGGAHAIHTSAACALGVVAQRGW